MILTKLSSDGRCSKGHNLLYAKSIQCVPSGALNIEYACLLCDEEGKATLPPKDNARPRPHRLFPLSDRRWIGNRRG